MCTYWLRLTTVCAIAVGSVLLATSCRSSSQTVTGPLGIRCAVQAQADTTTFPAAGGSATITISTNRECTWSVTSEATWLSLSSPAEGQGEASIKVTVAANSEPSARSGAIRLNDQRLAISQQGSPCEFQISSNREVIDPAGEDRTVHVTATGTQCEWTAAAEAPWITIAEGRQGRGNGAVTFHVEAAAGVARTGTLIVAGQVVLIEQARTPVADCRYSIGATALSVDASGGSREVPVSTSANCPWTAESHAPWITITSGLTGTGPGVVRLRVTATDGPSRTGRLSVAGSFVTVEQSPGCAYTVEPSAFNAPAPGGPGAIAVLAGGGCGWSAATSTPWISITSAANSRGDGRVDFMVAANAGPARAGSLEIAGRPVAVTQAAGCAYELDRSAISAPVAGGPGAVSVRAGGGCVWSAATSTPWISITSPANSSGDGRVTFMVAANSGPAREGSLAIAGQTVAVTQPSGCTYGIAPSAQDVAGTGGTTVVSVATDAGCPWTATTSVGWITRSPASGIGAGQVQLGVAANLSPPRTGTVVIAGQTFTVNQSSQCTYVIHPQLLTYDANGGNGAVLVIVNGPCIWTAESSADWIRMVPGYTSGTGEGLAQFTVPANPGPARTGSVRIAGQNVAITQAGR